MNEPWTHISSPQHIVLKATDSLMKELRVTGLVLLIVQDKEKIHHLILYNADLKGRSSQLPYAVVATEGIVKVDYGYPYRRRFPNKKVPEGEQRLAKQLAHGVVTSLPDTLLQEVGLSPAEFKSWWEFPKGNEYWQALYEPDVVFAFSGTTRLETLITAANLSFRLKRMKGGYEHVFQADVNLDYEMRSYTLTIQVTEDGKKAIVRHKPETLAPLDVMTKAAQLGYYLSNYLPPQPFMEWEGILTQPDLLLTWLEAAHLSQP